MTLEDLKPAQLDQLRAIGEGAAAIETLAELDPLLREHAAAHDEWEAWIRATSAERAEGLVSREYKVASVAHYDRCRAAETAVLRFARAYAARTEDV